MRYGCTGNGVGAGFDCVSKLADGGSDVGRICRLEG